MSFARPALVETVSPAVWAGFIAFVLVMLALDLGVFQRRAHAVSFREALTWSCVWIGLSTLFGLGIWWFAGPVLALEFATGYVLEKALSVDNLFVMLAIMRSFVVPPEQQQRVLLWGVLGALVLRAMLIAAGSALLSLGQPILWLFGGILLLAALKMLLPDEESDHVEKHQWVKRLVPTKWATPAILAGVSIELADVVFAVDSIPAVFSVTQHTFIVFTSNIFAILGLRSLYFVLAQALERFHLLRYGLAVVLAFVGAKMVLSAVIHLSVGLSLGVVCGVLLVSVLASLRFPKKLEMAEATVRSNRTSQ